MSKLRKAGSFLTAGVLAATVSVAGMSAATAADEIQVKGVVTYEGLHYINGWTLEGNPGHSSFKSIPLAGYDTITVEDGVLAGATWLENDGTRKLIDATIAEVDGSIDSSGWTITQVVKWLLTDDNAESFAAATTSVDGWDSKGVEMVETSSSGVYASTGNAGGYDSTAISGLHLVYSPNEEFSPFLISTWANGVDDETYWPDGQGLGTYAQIKYDEGDTSRAYGDLTLAVEDSEGALVEGVEIAATAAYRTTEGFNADYGTNVTSTTAANSNAVFSNLFYNDGSEQKTSFYVSFSYGDTTYSNSLLYVITNQDSEGNFTFTDGVVESVAGDLKITYEENGVFTIVLPVVIGEPDEPDDSDYADLTINLQDKDGKAITGVTLKTSKAYNTTEGLVGDGGYATTDEDGVAFFKNAFEILGDKDEQSTTFYVNFDFNSVSYAPKLNVVTGYDAEDGSVIVTEGVVSSDSYNPDKIASITYDGNGVFTIKVNVSVDDGTTGLPVTGAAGIGALVVVALLALGGGLALRRKKYQSEEA